VMIKNCDIKIFQCIIYIIVVDGTWQSWSNWGACSATCGPGLISRTRSCTQPLNGGQNCPGTGVDTKMCPNNPSCATSEEHF